MSVQRSRKRVAVNKGQDLREFIDQLSTVRLLECRNSKALEVLENRLLLSGIPVGPQAAPLASQVQSMANQLNTIGSDTDPLPLVNQPLKKVNQGSNPLAPTAPMLTNALNDPTASTGKEQLRDAIFNQMHSIMADRNNDHVVDRNDVDIPTYDETTQSYKVVLTLDETNPTVSMPLGTGLPALPVSFTSGQVLVTTGFHYTDFSWGLNNGVYFFDTSPVDELTVRVQMAVDRTVPIIGKVGFIAVTATDMSLPSDPGPATVLNGSTLFDMQTSGGVPVPTNPRFSSTSHVGLNVVTLNTAPPDSKVSIPDVRFGLRLDWNFVNANPNAGYTSWGNPPQAFFDNVAINLGGFLNRVMRPELLDLQKETRQFQPIFDVLKARIPILSDLSHLIGGDDINLIDLNKIISALPILPQGIQNLLNLTLQLAQTADALNQLNLGPGGTLVNNAWVPMGSFDLSTNAPLQTLPSYLLNQTAANWTSLAANSNTTINLAFIENWIHTNVAAPFGDQVVGLIEVLNGDTSQDGAWVKYPLLDDPKQGLYKLLLAQNTDLVTATFRLQNTPLNLEFELPTPIPVLDIALTANLTPDIYLHGGYDTLGLREFVASSNPDPIMFRDGLWIDPSSHAHLTGFVGVGPQVLGTVISPFAEGGVSADFRADFVAGLTLPDPTRAHAYVDLTTKPYLANVTGNVNVTLRVGVKIGVDFGFPVGFVGIEPSFDLGLYHLLSYQVGVPNPFYFPPAPIATLDPNTHILTLNMGSQQLRTARGIQSDEINEQYHISALSDQTAGAPVPGDGPLPAPGGGQDLLVTAFGVSGQYAGVSKVVASADDGNDIIVFTADVSIPVQISGGDGDDQITYLGTGSASITGDGGNDQIIAGGGNNTIQGGDGNDTITGGSGQGVVNSIDGGTGDDKLMSGPGPASLIGGDGADQLIGNEFDDTIDGGAGADTISAGNGNDSILGGTEDDQIDGGGGNDTISGGDGDDTIQGSDGDDSLAGNGGFDTIIGGLGADTLDGGDQDDVLVAATQQSNNDSAGNTVLGGTGNDSIVGSNFADSIDGGTGNDAILALAGNDTIHGSAGLDTIYGGDGNDSITGDDDADQIYGEAGDDSVSGGAGNDTISGSDGNDSLSGDDDMDQIIGESGNDTIHGGNANDTLDGGDGNDQIFGDAGGDSITGDAGADTLSGGDDDDTILGGTENDQITGDLGNDCISGDAGFDTIHGNDGADTISGGADDDDLYGDAGADSIHGDAGLDRIWGGTENDTLFGDSEADFIRGEAGNDVISGGTGADLLDAGDGDDSITGDAGADRIYGGTGNDTIHGHAAGAVGDDNAGDTVYGQDGNDQLFGEGGNDYLDGGTGVDTISGDAGNDTVLGGSGVGDSLLGGDGNDQITGSDDGANSDPNFLDLTYFGDVIDGGLGDDTILGLGGADNIQGGGGNDSINSGQGSDRVDGGDGNDFLYAGRGSGDSITGDAGADTIYGSDDGNDSISGGDDNDNIYGQGGNDSITGDAGDDYIDAGAGTDTVSGGGGNDEILGGGGNHDSISGDAGNDTLRGSDDGADILAGGAGNDRIFGNGGNDSISGGDDADTIDGGAGDDSITGDGGADLITGGANNDILYGQNAADSGEDNAVDSIYGDFGTDGNEAGSGGDQIYGQGGNDILFGEGSDDFIDGGAGASNTVNYGAGEGANPADFVPPSATPPPSIVPQGPAITQAGATIPTGVDYRGRWTELSSSSSGPGLSGSVSFGIEPSVATDSAGNQYAVWVDSRNGNDEIYFARHLASGGWQQLGGSASEGGVSNTAGSSRRPSIIIGADGNPMIAWTESTASGTEIRVAKYDPTANGGLGAWVAVGASPSSSAADDAVLVNTSAGPVVAYLDSSSGAIPNVYVKMFSGGAWSGLGGAGFASGLGVTAAAAGIRDFAVATDGTKVGVVWSLAGAQNDIQFREFSVGAWSAAETVGVTPGLSIAPTIAYGAGKTFVAWQDDSSLSQVEIYAAFKSGASWTLLGAVSNSKGLAAQPRLASGGGAVQLVWVDDHAANRSGAATSIFASRFNGTTFVPEVVDDASPQTTGVAPTIDPSSLALAVSTTGAPVITWGDSSTGRSQVYVRANTDALTGTTFTASAGTSVQSILDANDLNAGDSILISGSVAGFTVAAQDAGVIVIGLPGSSVTGAITLNQVNDVTVQHVNAAAIMVNQGSHFTLIESSAAAVTLNGTADSQIVKDTLSGTVSVTGGATNAIIENNLLSAGISFASGGATNFSVRFNTIAGLTGINLASASSGIISGNIIGASATGINIAASFTGSLDHNDIHGAAVGVAYAAGAPLNANLIHGNGIGVAASVAGASALGYLAGSTPNQIYSNTTGVQLTSADLLGQHIYSNTTGVGGSGTVGSTDFTNPNLIENNTTAVNITGTVQFNRIAGNTVGIVATNSQQIIHNLIYRNTTGVLVAGRTDVRIFNNTFYTPIGDNIVINGGSQQVEIRNNILWTENGYDINVADDSHSGFFSDYNDLYASGTGKIVHYFKDFTDILDWQDDVNRFDLHSIGSTAVNPLWAQPRFYDRNIDDYRVFDIVGQQRNGSPTIDSGDQAVDVGVTLSRTNLLTNPGFEASTTGWSLNAGATIATTAPTPWDGTKHFAAGPTVTAFAQQTIDLQAAGYNLATIANNAVVAGGRIRWNTLLSTDNGKIQITFLDASSNVINTPVVFASTNTNDRWELVGGRAVIPAGTRFVQFRFETNRVSGNNDSSFDGAFLYVQPIAYAPDQGAYGATPSESAQATATHIALRYPDLYADFDAATPHVIRWETYNNTAQAPVKLDLYQDTPDGPAFLKTIAASVPDTGALTWIPQNNAVLSGTYGLRIQVSLVGTPIVLDRSQETFTVPETGSNYYVNDSSTTGDTYATAPGSNRNTGKLASAPKPLVATLLRDYALTPTDTVFVDTGTYNEFNAIHITSTDDAGARITGPLNPANIATISRTFTGALGAVLDIDGGNAANISHLTLVGSQRGVWVHNGATRFSGSYLTTSNNTLEGVRLESDATQSTLDHFDVSHSGADGIYVGGLITSLTNSHSYFSALDAIDVANGGSTLVTGNEADHSRIGIFADNSTAGTTTLIGAADLSGANKVHDNSLYGIQAFRATQVAGNVVYNQTGNNEIGIYLQFGGNSSAIQNVVYSNSFGIYADANNGVITNDRVFGNASIGIFSSNSPVRSNTVYSNDVGIRIGYNSGNADVTNNLVYANTTSGINVQSSSSQSINVYNNTIYQPVGDGIHVLAGALNAHLENNIIWTQTGYDINVDPTSQIGFTSDYNDLNATASGKIALWQGVARPTLSSWQNADFTDQNSLTQNPLFANLSGADGALGFVSGVDYGSDDDFHLQSIAGSFHGGSFSPILNASGNPVAAPGVLTNDASQSPAIDRGDASFSFANETAPDGAFINLGFEGNTVQASRSPVSYVLVTRPDGGEVWPQGQSFNIKWRSETGGTYNIDLMQQGNPTPALSIASSLVTATTEGSFTWLIPGGLSAGANYLIRVTKVSPSLNDVSNATFTITAAVHNYYVNDNTAAGDQYTTAPGNDANTGLDPAHPKSSIRALLQAYTLGASDTIYVDTGVYNVSSNIIIPNSASGLTIIGATGNNSASQAYAGAIQADAPLAWYRLGDSGATAADSSGNALNASYSGNVTKGVTGVLPADANTAVSLDGVNGKLQLPSGFADFSTGFTWEGWVNPSTYATSQAFFDLGNPPPIPNTFPTDHIWFGRAFSNTLQLQIYKGTTPVVSISASGVLEQNKWQHFAVTIDPAGNIFIYKNGVQVATATTPLPNNVLRTSNQLGADGFVGDTPFGGGMDEVAFYNKALTGAQLRYHYDLAVATGSFMDRGNSSVGNYGIELQNADNVTLDHLNITGGYEGIHSTSTSAADASSNVTISNGIVFANNNAGIDIDQFSDHATIASELAYGFGADGLSGNDQAYGVYTAGPTDTVNSSIVHDSSNTGITVLGSNSTVSGSTVYSNSAGINIGGAASSASSNAAYANSTGIISGYSGSGPGTIQLLSNNLAHDNSSKGIVVGQDAQGVGNTVYGQTAFNAIGIDVGTAAIGVSQNIAYLNYYGIVGEYQGTTGLGYISANRVYDNSNIGIAAQESSIRGNTVYSNNIGIAAGGTYNADVRNNIVYSNTAVGIEINSGTLAGGATYSSTVFNNTVYQPTGDALRVLKNAPRANVFNNILWTQSGFDINVDPTSQVGFISDYNDLYTTASGKVAFWGGKSYPTRTDWYFQVGFDTHGQAIDPQFADIDGADNALAFNPTTTGAPIFYDDSGAGFTNPGYWSTGVGGYNGSYHVSTGAQFNTASWNLTGLTPGAIYQIAITYPNGPTFNSASNFTLFDGTASLGSLTVDQRFAPADFTDAGSPWKVIAYIRPSGTSLTLTENNGGILVADAVRVQQVQGDFGLDDNFHLQPASPAIDSGSLQGPGAYYLSESSTSGASASGGRINDGADGNSAQATPSPTHTVQILGPNGLEKQQAGKTTTITWRSFGLGQSNTVALINAGSPAGVGSWLANAYQSVTYQTNSFANAVDVLGVSNPAPQSVYQTVAYATSGVGNKMAYQLPVPNGTYTIRLHFAEGFVSGPNQRKFDIKLQGATVQSGYDVFAAAGGEFKATTLSFTVTAGGGSGILLELVNVLNVAEISGIEVTQTASGVASPTVNLSYSNDGGTSWTPIPGASSLSMNNLGQGSFDWAIPAGQSPGNYLVRVSSNDFAVSDASDAPFLLANSGHSYYVNDNTSAGDQYTTALGNDANDGKSPSSPMASIAAVLAAYHPGAGDTLYVDTGVYILGGNLLLSSVNSGLKIVGATTNAPTGSAYSSSGVLADGPVAYYRLGDSGSSAGDSSGHGANGTYVGGVTKGTAGAITGDSDSAITLDGTSGKVQLPVAVAASLATAGGSFSWEGWVYPTSTASAQAFFDLGNGQANDNIWFGRAFNSNLQLQIYRGASQVGALSANVLEQNKWQYLAVTIDGAGNAVMYKNGVAVSSSVLATPNAVVRSSNLLGKDNWSGDPYFAGQMDEAAFYDKALSAGQIRSHYDLGIARGTLLDRNSSTTGNFGIELQNADNVTLDELNVTGGYEGIHTTSTGVADASSNLTISNGSVYGNNNAGIDVDQYSDHASVNNETAYGLTTDNISGNDQGYGIYLQGVSSSVTLSTAHDSSNTGIAVLGDGSSVSGSTAFADGTGISVNGLSSQGTGNLVFGNSVGIYGYNSGGASTAVTLSNNTAHDNTSSGIYADHGALASGNTAYAQTASGAAGIRVGTLSQGAVNNVVYGNFNGIQGDFQGTTAGAGLIQGNRIYNNSNDGIVAQESAVRNNRVYSNGQIGIAGGGGYGGEISGNVVYANGVAAIMINSGSGANGATYSTYVLNNTVYQPVGDAIRILNNAPRVALRNNILWSQSGYDLKVDTTSQVGFTSDYNDLYTPTGKVAFWGGKDFPARTDWYYKIGFDGHGFSADPQFTNVNGADGILGYSGGVDHGADDDFHLQSTSPSIDAGDVGGYYLSETAAGAAVGGGRVNQGAFGNTSGAEASPTRTLQVLSPNGLEKVTAGKTTTITWRSFGLGQSNTVALINAGSPAGVGSWLANAYQSVTYQTNSFANAVDVLGVSNPAPQSVYQTVAYATSGVGNKMAYQLPVPNGTYTIRLHFAEGFVSGPNQRKFDIKLQGATVQSGYDVFAAAGGEFKATTLSFTVTAGGGSGILLELVNVLNVAEISGIEVTQTASGVASPTVNLSYSNDGGTSWTPIPGASSLSMNNLGQGSFDWAIPAGQSPGNYLVRVSSNDFAVSDASDAPFLLANSGHSYYVNDNTSAGDQYTTALGNDANDGKSPSSPMASIAAVLAAYHPGAGDTLYVDTGVYILGGNLLLSSVNSGLKIVGATTNAPTGSAYSSSGVLADGPVAYYRLGDSGSSAGDSSGHGANGTYVGGVTKGTAGAITGDSDSAITLDGTSGKVQLPVAVAASLATAGGSFSWEGWVYPTSTASAQAFFDLGNGQANDNIWFGRAFNSNLQLQIYRGASQVGALSANVLEQNKWQYLAVTIDGAGNAVMYKNGVAVSSSVLATPNAVVRSSNLLGKDNWSGDPYFAGQMDEAAFYDKALSAGQIRSHYDLGIARGTLLDRNSSTTGNFGIELQNADNVTLDELNVTGGYEGIHTTSTGVADASSNLTISNGSVYGNNNAGIDVDQYSDHASVNNETAYGLTTDNISGNDQGYGIYLQGVSSSVTLSTAHDSSNTGIAVLGDGSSVSGSTAFADGTGISVNGLSSQGTGNLVFGNSVGIYGYNSGGASTAVTLSNNTAHDNTSSGIYADHGALASGNTAYAQTASGAAGIRVGTLSQGAVNNVVYGNFNGIQGDFQGTTAGAGLIQGNRIYNNSNDGIVAQESAVRNNRVYSNGQIGIAGGGGYGGEISGNVVYANGVAAIMINSGSGANGATYSTYVLNNTVYQPVGDAIRILNNAPRVALRNNILQVTAGFDISLDPTSQSGFTSDYNDLSRGNDPRAHVGLLSGITRDALTDWRAGTLAVLGSQQDSASLATDPGWVDTDGTDNVLGYTTANGGYDGGGDDNFYVSAHSPAIDSGNSWLAPHTDLEGFNRFDDPATTNTGSSDYREAQLSSAPFALGGTAKGWRSNNTFFQLTLPFSFNYFGSAYTTAFVSTEGFIQFNSNNAGDPANSIASLATQPRIAPMWDDLRTDQAGNDIFVDTSVANQITIRWNATNQADGSNVNFSATLFSDGRIRFNYGAGNTNLTPTIGMSAGTGLAYLLSAYNGQSNLTNANGVEFALSNGFVDMGAYEYRTTSVDTTPPTITSTVPAGVNASGTTPKLGQIGIGFSEQLNSIDAAAVSSFELRGAGADNQLDTADDIRYIVAPTYLPGSTQVTLNITGATTGTGTVVPWNGGLPVGKFRLTVFSLVSGGIHDLSGLELDGDNNGTAGGNYVRTFTVANTTPVVAAMAGVNIFAGVPLTANGSFNDPDAGDSWTATVDYNDGTGTHPLMLNNDKTFNLSELYASPGVHTVTVTVKDTDGAIGTGTLLVTVIDPAGLSASFGAVYTITGGPAAPVLNVISGTVTIAPALYATFPNLGANVAGGASLVVNGSQHLTSLTLANGANASIGGNSTLTVDALSLIGLAKLDVGAGYLIINYPSGQGAATLAQLTSLITSGRGGGAWTGPGIDSSAAAAGSGKSIGLENNNTGTGSLMATFGGQSVGPNAILIRYTLKGDANLDGTVGFADLVAVAQHYGTNGNTWSTGDFDYDGLVGFADLVSVAQAYGQSLPASGEPVGSGAVVSGEELAPASAQPMPLKSALPAAAVAAPATSAPDSVSRPVLRPTTKPVVSRVPAIKASSPFSSAPIVPTPIADAEGATPRVKVLSGRLKVSRGNDPQERPVQVFSRKEAKIGATGVSLQPVPRGVTSVRRRWVDF